MDLTLILAVGLIGLVAAAIYWRSLRHQRWLDQENMPAILAQARLVYSEKYLRIRRPQALCGVVDQVYKLANSTLCPIDTKTRNYLRVFESDIIQLSVYAYILRHRRRWFMRPRVTPFGFIRIQLPNKVHYAKVTLYDDENVTRLVSRYKTLQAGKRAPQHSQNPAFCRQCAYLGACPVSAVR
jgi:CRISPR/Cas system-associated exonuclease Cas4 (RecB family)